MISHYLSKKDFPVQLFLKELDKKELLFLDFLFSQEKEEKINAVCTYLDDVDTFFKRARKNIGNDIKKLKKEELIQHILKKFSNLNFNATKGMYKNIYEYELDNDKFIYPHALIINKFASVFFTKTLEDFTNRIIAQNHLQGAFILDEFYKSYTFSNRPVLNSIGILALIVKLDTAKNLLKKKDITVAFELREYMFIKLIEQFQEIEDIQKNEEKAVYKKQDTLLKRIEKELNKKEENIDKLKEINKQQNATIKINSEEILKLQEKRKDIVDSEFLSQLYSDMRKKDQQIEQLMMDIKNLKEKPQNLYKSMIERLNSQILELKRSLQERLTELKESKKKIEYLETKTIEEHLNQYIEKHGFNERLYKKMDELLKEYYSNPQNIKEEKEEEKEAESRPEQRIGYCKIDDSIHYVVFPDGSKLEILNLPENTYIGENQFVKVDREGNFKWLFGYKYEELENNSTMFEFGSVVFKNNKPVMIRAVWDEIEIKDIPNSIQLRDSQVIAVDKKGKFLRFYKTFHHNADQYIKSIKAKGQYPYYILKIFPNGILLRNIETDIEEFKLLNTENREIKEQQIVCVKDNEIIQIFQSPKFYTLSSFYKKAEHGVAEIKNDQIFIRKLSGELAIVNGVPEHITTQDGDILKVDEFNNLLIIKKEEAKDSKNTDERRILASNQNNYISKKTYTDKIEVHKEILIIGKITYKNSYKMAFYKKGYRADVIDGYESWVKIKSATKGKDCIVVMPDFISHDNMWKVKEEIANIPVVYPEDDGANRVVEEVENKLCKKSVI